MSQVAAVSQATSVEPRLRGRWLLVARGVWLLLAAGMLTNFLIGIPAYYTQLRTICTTDPVNCGGSWLLSPANVVALHQLGLSVDSYAAFFIVFVVAVSLIFLGVGALIFWRKSDEWLGLFTSLLLVLFGSFGFTNQLQIPNLATFSLSLPFLGAIHLNLVTFAQYPTLAVFLLIFPTGRFAPRWTWVIVPLWVADTILFNLPSPYGFPDWPGWLGGIDIFVIYGSVAAAQVYRYRRVYTQPQRQQTKWVVFGFATGLLFVALASIIGSVVPGLNAPDAPYQLLNGVFLGVLFLSIPFSIGIAILRYRLWGIDTLINKALVYGSLTALLGALYAGLIIGLVSLASAITGTSADEPVALVIATLAIAALFLPVRRRIQAIIDRRFYRQKYDTEKTLAAFSATLRNEVDLEQLRAQLIAVVQETMQPAHVSLWLREPERRQQAQGTGEP